MSGAFKVVVATVFVLAFLNSAELVAQSLGISVKFRRLSGNSLHVLQARHNVCDFLVLLHLRLLNTLCQLEVTFNVDCTFHPGVNQALIRKNAHIGEVHFKGCRVDEARF